MHDGQRPALLLLGDSRSRWWLLSMAQQLCDPSLSCFRYLGAPRCNATADDKNHESIVAALEGAQNWRSGGGYTCAATSSLSRGRAVPRGPRSGPYSLALKQ